MPNISRPAGLVKLGATVTARGVDQFPVVKVTTDGVTAKALLSQDRANETELEGVAFKTAVGLTDVDAAAIASASPAIVISLSRIVAVTVLFVTASYA